MRRSQHDSRRRPDGFTLLELLVVLLILGLLASFVGPRYFSQVGKSEASIAKTQIQAFGQALDQYRLDTGRFPSTEQGLNALVTKPVNEPRWNGPYLRDKPPLDPWGRPYRYRAPGNAGKDYEVISFGRDGAPGGQGDNADVTN
jgi:general secretion pathway protein G